MNVNLVECSIKIIFFRKKIYINLGKITQWLLKPLKVLIVNGDKMAKLKIFISSTCYDLNNARDQLRGFISNLGYEPVMSEYSDILFDPRTHTHTSCLNEISNVDMVILLVGSRFGGQAVPEALSLLDLENLEKSSFDTSILESPEKLSVTQLEVMKAIEFSIPVFAFIDEKVMHDHFVYQTNKELSGQIKYPSIEKQETAKYIFEFINFLRHRMNGNSVIPFSNVEDIENHLRKQWASLFQRLLKEQRDTKINHNKMLDISEKIEDIKTALISMTGNAQNREIARGTLKYRRLIDFIIGLNIPDTNFIFTTTENFDQMLNSAGIVKIEDIRTNRMPFGHTAFVKDDGTFYESRVPRDYIYRLSMDWGSFINLTSDVRRVIYDAINDMERSPMGLMKYRAEQFSDFMNKVTSKENDTNEDDEF